MIHADVAQLDSIFEKAANDLRDTGYAIIDGFLSVLEVQEILEQLSKNVENGDFKKAGIGKGDDYLKDKTIRGDHIRWIEETEDIPTNRTFLPRIKALQQFLNRFCFLGLVEYEYHQTFYPVGTHYERHTDTFQNDESRVISSVCYLNLSWEPADGGELLIFPEAGDPVRLAPRAGRLALFESHLEHQVLTCHAQRYSLTG